MPWQSPIVQRVAWKEFRSQIAVWASLLVFLLILQFWWLAWAVDHTPLNLFSLAFVMSGCFAMTSSVLLFAGENEPQTDRFLRQLPLRVRDLLIGKLGTSALAVLGFFVASMFMTLAFGAAAGRFQGHLQTVDDSDPLIYLQSAVGIWVWGLFYSLVIRKVLWSVLASVATEFIVSGLIHNLVLDFRLSLIIVPVVYWTVIAAVLVVDFKLMRGWALGEEITWPKLRAQVRTAVSTPEIPLPHYRWYRQAAVLGALAGALVLVIGISTNLWVHQSYYPAILLVVGACGLVSIATWRILALLSITPSHRVTAAALRQIPLSGVGLGWVAIWSFLCAGSVIFNAIRIGLNQFFGAGISQAEQQSAMIWFILPGIAWWLGHWVLTARRDESIPFWQGLLQTSQQLLWTQARPLVPLLWMELRRIVPVLTGSLAIGLLITLWESGNRERQGFIIVPLLITSLLHGLMTLLPDRSHGTVRFLVERGVPARRVLGVKVLLWGTSLLLFLGILLVSSPGAQEFNRMVSRPHWSGPMGMVFTPFLIGVLCSAWIKRPVMTIAISVCMSLIGQIWVILNVELSSPLFWTVTLPMVLILIGVFYSATQSLLEMTSWRRKLRQVAWVLLASSVGWSSLALFRMTEVPDLSDVPEMQQLNAAAPSLSSTNAWVSTFGGDEDGQLLRKHLDSLHDDSSLSAQIVQPAAGVGWNGATTTFQHALSGLKLGSPECDLDAAWPHLTKWLVVTEQMARNSRTMEGWYETLDARRAIYAAIRRWANHPAQTGPRLTQAFADFTTNRGTLVPSALPALSRERQNMLRSFEERRSPDPRFPLSRWGQLFATMVGDQPRVRRMIDLHYYLTMTSGLTTPQSLEGEYQKWWGNTRASAVQYGVDLPYHYHHLIYSARFERCFGAAKATTIVLELQKHRLETGRFPIYPESILTGNRLDPFLVNSVMRISPPPAQIAAINRGQATLIDELQITAGPLPQVSLQYALYWNAANPDMNAYLKDWEAPHPHQVRYRVESDYIHEDNVDLLPKSDTPPVEQESGDASALGGGVSSEADGPASPNEP